ncbi:hypothetical protein [Streptomyces sp. NPDC056600]|uniref:hypothetical protein n=1 Tax=Streptomyces sp. NPDC056600 TaxID=3345874 RepID=UPI0036B39783
MSVARRFAAFCAAVVLLTGCSAVSDGQDGRDGRDGRGAQDRGDLGPAAWDYDHTGQETNASFLDIAAASADDAWAVGKTPVTGWVDDQKTLLLHHDGKEWRPYDLPPALSSLDDFPSVRLDSCGPGDVWLFADDSGAVKHLPPFAAHWDGAEWRAVDLPEGFPGHVTSAVVLDRQDAWVAGDTAALWHWDGREWRVFRLPGRAWTAVAGTSGKDVWAVGRTTPADGYAQPATAHWDGSGWSTVKMPAMSPRRGEEALTRSLHDVFLLPGREVLAIGRASSEGGDTDAVFEPLMLRWDGSRWREDEGRYEGSARWRTQDGGRCCVTHQAGTTLFLSPGRHVSPSGEEARITMPPCLAGRPGRVGGDGCGQKLQLEDYAAVPGTQDVWGVGSVRGEDAVPVIVRLVRS